MEKEIENASNVLMKFIIKIKHGEKFETLAEKYSTCSSGKNAKGSLGKFKKRTNGTSF